LVGVLDISNICFYWRFYKRFYVIYGV